MLRKSGRAHSMTIYFVTGNKEKFREVKDILKGFDVEQIELDLPELQGELDEIVREKARLAAEKSNKPVFVEDTSLCFNALNGLPGPYIKDFINKIGVPGIYELAGKYSDWMNALGRLIESPSLRAEIGQRLNNKVEKVCDFKSNVDRWVKVYKDLVEG